MYFFICHSVYFFIIVRSIQVSGLLERTPARIKGLRTFFERLMIFPPATLYHFDFKYLPRVSIHFGHTYSTQLPSLYIYLPHTVLTGVATLSYIVDQNVPNHPFNPPSVIHFTQISLSCERFA